MTGDLKAPGNSIGRMSWKSDGSNYFAVKFSTLRLNYTCFLQIGYGGKDGPLCNPYSFGEKESFRRQ
jgi:hypothetical protein